MGRRNRQIRISQGESVEVSIESLSRDGRGVGRLEGKAIFVAGALPGERVRAVLSIRHRDYDEAEMEAVLEASSDRVAPRCRHFGVCGGCSLQHLDADAQISAKQQILIDALERIGNVVPENILPALRAPVWGYRRKARLGVRYVAKKGRVLIGFRERRGRLLADVSRCEVLVPEVGERITELAELVSSLKAYQQIPQIEVMVGDGAVCLVFRHLVNLCESDLLKLTAFAQSTGISVALQPKGPETIVPLWPAEQDLYYEHEGYGARVAFQPGDFIQVNAPINRQMVTQAMNLLDVKAGDRVLELFSGLGNFTLPLLRLGAKVTAVEGDLAMTERAAKNVDANGLGEATHYAADLTNPESAAVWLNATYDKLLLDPPRSGAREILSALGRFLPSRIVYVSCDPATLARDAGDLVRHHGFTLKATGVLDMFPHTTHVETMALLVR